MHVRSSRVRRGLTLAELLIATAIMATMTVSIAALASAVQTSADLSFNRGAAVQHARVAVKRIQDAARNAVGNEQFPGIVAFSTKVSDETFPDTLVVWLPESGAASDPAGLPRYDELVIFCPNPSSPNELLEIRPNASAAAPSLDESSQWESALEIIKSSENVDRFVITDRLRTATVSDQSDQTLGAARFRVRLTPSEDEWEQFKIDYAAGSADPNELPWPLDFYGLQTGLQQCWCRFELQLTESEGDNSADAAIPFFGSAAIHIPLNYEE